MATKLNHHRDVIRNGIEPFGSHQVSYPLSLIKPFIVTTTKENDIVFDPFMGSGTTAVACAELNRRFTGCEINTKFCEAAMRRIAETRYSILLENCRYVDANRSTEEQDILCCNT